jgi:lysyl endopeptidase
MSITPFASDHTPSHAAPIDPTNDVAFFDTTQGLWHVGTRTNATTSFYFGNPGDYPMVGDWDCDGVDTPGLYRQSDGYVYLRNSNTQGVATIKFYFGNPGDIPLAGDFDGDGCDSVSIYRPSEQRIYVINDLGSNDGGLGAADYWYLFGNPGDKPFVGDFDGDEIDTVGLHRESTGLVYYRNTHTQGNADAQFIYGDPGDRIVADDWNHDGHDSPGLFRPSRTTVYLRFANTQGNADAWFMFGEPDWLPVAATFTAP